MVVERNSLGVSESSGPFKATSAYQLAFTVDGEGNPMHVLRCNLGSLKGNEVARQLQRELELLLPLLPTVIDLQGCEIGEESLAKLFFFSQSYHRIHGKLLVINVSPSAYDTLERLDATSMTMIEFRKCATFSC